MVYLSVQAGVKLSRCVRPVTDGLALRDAGAVMGMAVVGFGLVGVAALLLLLEAASSAQQCSPCSQTITQNC